MLLEVQKGHNERYPFLELTQVKAWAEPSFIQKTKCRKTQLNLLLIVIVLNALIKILTLAVMESSCPQSSKSSQPVSCDFAVSLVSVFGKVLPTFVSLIILGLASMGSASSISKSSHPSVVLF